MRLANKVAVITGSGRGIGRGSALAMAKEGAKIVINDIDLKPAQEVMQEIKKRGGQAVVCCESVASMEGGEKIIQCAIDHFGRIDILVNNAAIIQGAAELKDMTQEDWDAVIAVNLKGTFACTKAAIKHMINQKSGRIINITSAAGRKGVTKTSHYAATKHGIIGLTTVWARELGPYNITVNAISPSALTRLATGFDEAVMDSKFMEEYSAQKALKRTSQISEIERDIGPAFVFLASDEAAYITGEIIRVDGGAI